MLRETVLRWAENLIEKRPPDFTIGPPEEKYCLRWWVIKRNRWFNIYLHLFNHDDEDRALHDHPWMSCSWLLKTGYYEVLGKRSPDGTTTFPDETRKVWRRPGALVFRRASSPHRIVLERRQQPLFGEFKDRHPVGPDVSRLVPVPAISLFITGPVVRDWGFHCPKGWVPWQRFTDSRDKGLVGKGCEG
jgi:hypothetical protein